MVGEHQTHNHNMLVSLVLLLAAAFGLWVFFQIQRPKNFPPGPPPIPLLGNLLEIQLDNPIADLERVKYQKLLFQSVKMSPCDLKMICIVFGDS